ncbi:hypothetical protein ACF0H5_008006 [Mactra antiquata]
MFVKLHYGENEQLIVNPNCRQLTLMGYIREKCQYDKKAFIDLLDESGKLAMLHTVDPQDNVSDKFEHRVIYIPVMLEKSAELDTFKTVKPLLEDWEKLYPQIERKIKILTGEVKRKKSPLGRTLDPRAGKNLDKKNSTLAARSDLSGRSSSYLGRASSMSQSGKGSGANSGKQSASGRKSIVGKADVAKFAQRVKGKRK